MSGEMSVGEPEIERHHLLGLSLAPDVGPKTIRALVGKLGNAGAVIEGARRGDARIPERLRAEFLRAEERATAAREVCTREGFCIAVRGDAEFPSALECLSDVPEVVFLAGDLEAFEPRRVSVVGARECSEEGADLAFRFGARLAEEGWATVSGLARGIDAAVHRGSLEAGGRSIAVLGCGLDVIYPEENRALRAALLRDGLLVSEFAPGFPPLAGNFPRRNRILAALGEAAVLVESRLRSGALITCRHAIDQGKDVFVVPGSPRSPVSAGPLQLLRDGARLIRHADDLLEDLGGISGEGLLSRREFESAEEAVGAPASPEAERERAALEELLGSRKSPGPSGAAAAAGSHGPAEATVPAGPATSPRN